MGQHQPQRPDDRYTYEDVMELAARHLERRAGRSAARNKSVRLHPEHARRLASLLRTAAKRLRREDAG
jgi:predicted phage-related endonuclease